MSERGPEPRLKTAIWVSMAVRRAFQTGSFAAVLRRGDEDAGGVLAVMRNRAGMLVVLSQTRTGDGTLAWLRATGPDPVLQDVGDAYVARAVSRDPDLWVLEFDTLAFETPFDAVLI